MIPPEATTPTLIVDTIWNYTPMGDKAREVRVYENIDGKNGKMIEQHFFGEDDIIESSQFNQSMTWNQFYKKYKDLPQYKS